MNLLQDKIDYYGVKIDYFENELNSLYKASLGDKSGLDIIKTSQKAGKALLPAWIINDWIKTYKIKI